MCGISFGPNGDLYGMDNDADVLLRFDMNTGASTIVGSLGLSIGACGLAYDCKNDVLYGADAATDTLFTLNPVTGTATQVIATTVPFKAVGRAYEPATVLLLAATDDAFYELDPITGAGTLLGFFDPNNHINDLALYPPCP